MIGTIVKKVLGSKNERELKRMQPLVDKINGLEAEFEALSEADLKAKTAGFKKRYADGEPLSDLLPEVHFHSHDKGKLTVAFLLGIILAYAIGAVEPADSHLALQLM